MIDVGVSQDDTSYLCTCFCGIPQDEMLSAMVAGIDERKPVLLPNQVTVNRIQLSELGKMFVDDGDFHAAG
jgi:hypothetical protein